MSMHERRRNMYEMHYMKRNSSSINSNEKNFEVSKQKERHIVTWTQEEDDILREQIRNHGTDNWTIIASKFKDKSTRQCRRRWYTYLNSDFKKGGWTPEEDMLLCEAQKIFGNRWTEIAKVVSGRTDNAVKNRFSTLCKKMAKREALAKENNNSFINLNNKRVIFPNGCNIGVSETAAPPKKMRMDVSSLPGKPVGGKLTEEIGRTNQLVRPPLAVLEQNIQHGVGELSAGQHVNETNNVSVEQQVNNTDKATTAAADNKISGTFLKKDDPRALALLQQAELLSSLALKVNSENTYSLENAWQVLQDYLGQNKESGAPRLENSCSSFEVENFRDLIEELRSCSEELRQCDLLTSSPASSVYSTGSTLQTHAEADKIEQGQTDQYAVKYQDTEAEQGSSLVGGQNVYEKGILPASATNHSRGASCRSSDMEFSSPSKVNPLFRSLAAEIPSPKFSESEKHFLLKTLGLESPSSNRSANTSRLPPCKRVLLHRL